MAFNSTEKTNIAYKLFYQIAGTANASPGAQYWYNESLAWSPIIPLNKLWVNFYNIQPASNKTQADANVLVNTDLQKVTVRLTVISTSNNRAYLAVSGSTLENWIQPTLIRTASNEPSVGYGVSLWNGDPNLGGTELDTTYHADAYGEPSWSFNYSSGLVLISTDEAATYKAFYDGAGLYLQGYRYVGATGLTSSAITSLSQLTDVTIVNVQSGQTLMYSAGTWRNTSALIDLSAYYTSAQTNTLLNNLYQSLSGKPYLYQLQDVSSAIVSAVNGDALIWDSGSNKWIATGITVDMTQYYTKTEIDLNFYNSAQTLENFSTTGHSHYLTGLTDVNISSPVTGQVVMYSAGTWVAASTALSGSYVSLSGDTMVGYLSFSFMSGTTNRLLYVNTGGTVNSGEDIVSLYLSGSSLINYIQTESNWTGSTFIGTNLSAYTLYEGQKYIDINYFYEYLDGTLYRTYYANKDHNHNDLYYTQTELLVDGVLDSRYLTASAQSYLVTLGDTNIVVSALTSNSYLKFNSVSSKWEKYDIDISLYAKTADVVPNTRQLSTNYPLAGGGYLTANLTFSHAGITATTSSVAPSGSVIVGMVFDGYGHITSYTTSNINSLIKSNLYQLDDVSIASLLNKQSLVYDSGASRWRNTTLNKSYISDFVESAYTHTYGNEVINGDKNFTGLVTLSALTITNSLYVGGNLYVAGTATTIYTADLVIKDRLITINSGQTGGYGVFGGIAGLEIRRGVYPDYLIVFDEGGSVNYSGGTLRIGISGATQAVAMREDNPINGGIAFWDNEHTRFNTSANLIFSGDTVYLNGTLIANIVITATTINANAVNTKSLTLSSGVTVWYIQNETGLTNSAETLLTEQAIVDYVSTQIAVENLWDRTGTILIPHTANDSINLGLGDVSATTFIGNTMYVDNINGKSITLSSGITALYIQDSTGLTNSAQTLLTEQAIVNYVNQGIEKENFFDRVGDQVYTIDTINSIKVGNSNTLLNSIYSSIIGGNSNLLDVSDYSSIIGGGNNVIAATTNASIIGGDNNILSNGTSYSSIIGGYDNRLLDGSAYASIIGGMSNSLSDFSNLSIIAGGYNNILSASTHASIIGGNSNLLDVSDYSSIIGGQFNILSGTTNSAIIAAENIVGTLSNTLYTTNINAKSLTLSSGITALYVQNETGITIASETILTEQVITEYLNINLSNYTTLIKFGDFTGNTYFIAGRGAGVSNTDTYLVAIGYQAGYNNKGVGNTFIGYRSGMSTTGVSNTFVGYGSGAANVNGGYNSFFGTAAGYLNKVGDYNTYLGFFAGYNNTGGSSNVFLGYYAGYNEFGSNKLYISNSNTSNPLIYGEFDNNLIKINGTLSATTLFANLNWTYITSTPTTISGYNITNAYTKTEVDTISINDRAFAVAMAIALG